MKKGFTLVELSIVLVIIGLLIGGILIGQSLIDSAKIQAQVRQIQQFDIAMRTFKGKFRYKPGDLPNATSYFGSVSGSCASDAGTGSQTCNGDGDGTIDYLNSDNTTYESWRAWEHLSISGILKEEYSGILGTSCDWGNNCIEVGVNVPEGALDKRIGISLFEPAEATAGPATIINNEIYVLGSEDNTQNPALNGLFYGRALTPQQALSFDAKLDDGIPFAGDVVAMRGSLYSTTCTGGNYLHSTAAYDVSYNDRACTLFIGVAKY